MIHPHARIAANIARMYPSIGREVANRMAARFGVPPSILNTENTIYKTGCEVFPDSFDPDPRVECSHGIHFFITREEAEAY
jgi:hypothetical protein